MGKKRRKNQEKYRQQVKLGTEKRKLKKSILYLLKKNKVTAAGLLMERYKSKFGGDNDL
tara:strand:+ start:190 stop:366 length:177 start_codon:yes stop_codon:yes gene_type:complete